MPAFLSPAELPLSLLQRLCSAAQMRRWDAEAIATGTPVLTLMENAAQAVVRLVCSFAGLGPVLVCCGEGNNGGDGYAVARLLKEAGLEVRVLRLGLPRGEEARSQQARWERLGESLRYGEDSASAVAQALSGSALIVDALLGTGLSRPVEGELAGLIAAINQSPAPCRIGVDVPSGIDADTGACPGEAVRCTHTVSFQVAKQGCFQHPGAAYAGQVLVEDIGIPLRWEGEDAATYLLTRDFARVLLPPRPPDGHKGHFGHLLGICGSAGMGGAALLAGLGALRAGAGLVTLGVPRCLRDRFVGQAPELMTLSSEEGAETLLEAEHAAFFIAAAQERTAVVLGCGLGRAAETQAFVRAFIAGAEAPLLIDADGLNALDGAALSAYGDPLVITPHPGELSRLSGLDTAVLGRDRLGYARRLARQWGVVLLLKGAKTVVAAPTGEVFINPAGDQGLATAGAGDVLSGIIGGLMAQGMSPLAASLLGAYLHGRARDCLREELAAASFSAGDILPGLNLALRELQSA